VTISAPGGMNGGPPPTGSCAAATGSKRPSSPRRWTTGAKWEQATAPSRRLAIAADAELRRRHPGQRIEPLRSAEPVPVSDNERRDLALTADNKIGQLAQWVQDLAAQRMVFRDKLEERHPQPIPNEDPDWEGSGQTFPSPWTAGKDTILQPPKPQITPSAKILQLTAEQDASPEAAG
jgi:hypothetical protein